LHCRVAVAAREGRRASEVNWMSDPRHETEPRPEPVPLGQRLFDRPFLLLVACLVVMFVFYTGWGLIELASLEQAPLP
jgi:hypothetical protein